MDELAEAMRDVVQWLGAITAGTIFGYSLRDWREIAKAVTSHKKEQQENGHSNTI